MGEKIVALIAAGLAGATMATQGKLNSELSRGLGLFGATFVVHLIATAILATVVLIGGVERENLAEITRVKWYTLLGGPLNVLIIYAVAYSLSKVNTAAGTTGIIVMQLLTAALIDHLGILGAEKLPFTPLKFAAIALIAIGAKILLS
ncbi:MAG: DMT family transporter [Bacillota bacterium]|nr:DMT family transporter [Bacillota bacterium]